MVAEHIILFVTFNKIMVTVKKKPFYHLPISEITEERCIQLMLNMNKKNFFRLPISENTGKYSILKKRGVSCPGEKSEREKFS